MAKIEIETLINAPINRCFDLARSIDLHQISTSKTNEYVIAGRKNGLIELNETVTWRAKHFGIWQNLTAKITKMNSPYYFCDEMVKGAFKNFKHEHYFSIVHNQTLMKDVFIFQLPFGIIGSIFNQLILTDYMRQFLIERNQIVKQVAESNDWKKFIP